MVVRHRISRLSASVASGRARSAFVSAVVYAVSALYSHTLHIINAVPSGDRFVYFDP